jgi:hypothetical protein
MDNTRPDFLMLRVLAAKLIMFDSIEPSSAWLNASVPAVLHAYAIGKKVWFNLPHYLPRLKRA